MVGFIKLQLLMNQKDPQLNWLWKRQRTRWSQQPQSNFLGSINSCWKWQQKLKITASNIPEYKFPLTRILAYFTSLTTQILEANSYLGMSILLLLELSRQFYQKINKGIISWLTYWFLNDCNWTRTQNHLAGKRTLSHLVKLSSCSH